MTLIAYIENMINRPMTSREIAKFRELRRLGYANPIDIHREMQRQGFLA